MPPDDVTVHRVEALETAVRKLQDESVSKEWLAPLLDHRFARLGDQINNLAEDVGEMRAMDKQRRLAVYSAVIIGIVSLVTALVMVGMTLPPGVGP